jgi:tetratricopeptide (TPR) repeat protein
VHRLWAFTGGNPFYASEVVRDLVTREGTNRAHDAWRVPAGVRDVLRERLRSLSPVAQEVVACAAVLGREVDVNLLIQVADQPEGRSVDALEEILRNGWLVEAERPWQASYTFRHALMREAVHADIPAPRRQHLHLRAADVLESQGLKRGADVAAAAGHLRAAGSLADRERAAELSLRAADEAADLYAWDEAVAHAEAAVALLDHAGAPPAQQAHAAMCAAELLFRSSVDYRRAIEHLEAALDRYRTAGDEAAVASVRSRLGQVLSVHHSVMDIPQALEHFAAVEGVLTEGVAAFNVHSGRALAALFGLRTDQGCVAAQRAVAIAEGGDRRDLVARVRPTEAFHRFNRGELALAQRLTDEAWTTAQDLGDPHLGWEAVTTGAIPGNVYLLDPVSAETWCRRGLAQPRFDTLTRPHEGVSDQLVYALASMGELVAAHDTASRLPVDAVSKRYLLVLDGDWEAAERAWTAALHHDLDNGDLLNAALNAYWLGQVRTLLGRQPDALAALRGALAISLDGPQIPAELMTRAELARLLAADGDVAEASEHLTRCDEILTAGEDWRGQAGTVELARGAVAGAQERHEQVDAAHARALEIFTTYRLPWWRGETLLAWARWLMAGRRGDDAEAKYLAAHETYGELDAHTRWVGLHADFTGP